LIEPAATKMKPAKLPALLFLGIGISLFASIADGQAAPLSTVGGNPVPALLQQMIGTWNVQQRMWPGSGAEAINLPSAIARRRLVGSAFLEEIMELPSGSKQEPFTRIAYLNYNAVSQHYEYFSLHSRAPQMMNEKSYEGGILGKMDDQGFVTLYGGCSWHRSGETPQMPHSGIGLRSGTSKRTAKWSGFI
jgi:hypothetical protein